MAEEKKTAPANPAKQDKAVSSWNNSSSDYQRFVENTIVTMNLSGAIWEKKSPDPLVLSLTRSASSKKRTAPSTN